MAMMAMTTSSSISVKPFGSANGNMGTSLAVRPVDRAGRALPSGP